MTAVGSTYSEGFFSSPSDLANAAIQSNLAVSNIDRAVSSSSGSAPQSWVDSWDAFKLVWQSWYNRNFASGDALSWLTSDLEGNLEQYQQQISGFASQAASYGISIPGSVPSVPRGPLDGLPSVGAALGALGLALAIIIVWKVF